MYMYSGRRGAATSRQRNSGIISLIQDDRKPSVVLRDSTLVGRFAGWLVKRGAVLMMREKIKPSLAAVSLWVLLRKPVVWFDNLPPL